MSLRTLFVTQIYEASLAGERGWYNRRQAGNGHGSRDQATADKGRAHDFLRSGPWKRWPVYIRRGSVGAVTGRHRAGLTRHAGTATVADGSSIKELDHGNA